MIPARQHLWAYLAAAWAIVFAAPHVYWATGRLTGLDTALLHSDGSVITSISGAQQLQLLGIVAVLLCGAATALLTLRTWPPRYAKLARRVLVGLTWFGAALLAFRVVSIGVSCGLWLSGGLDAPDANHANVVNVSRWFLLVWMPWFALGAFAWARLGWIFTTGGRLVRQAPGQVQALSS